MSLELFLLFAAYAYMGARLGKWFAIPARKRLFNKACASLLGIAGIGLLLSQAVVSTE